VNFIVQCSKSNNVVFNILDAKKALQVYPPPLFQSVQVSFYFFAALVHSKKIKSTV